MSIDYIVTINYNKIKLMNQEGVSAIEIFVTIQYVQCKREYSKVKIQTVTNFYKNRCDPEAARIRSQYDTGTFNDLQFQSHLLPLPPLSQ
jgi:hypothetical protein